jgi:hypothetical protein
MKITVTAKITAGVHPIHGAIIAGQTYVIEDHQFAEQLFERTPPALVPVGARHASPDLALNGVAVTPHKSPNKPKRR